MTTKSPPETRPGMPSQSVAISMQPMQLVKIVWGIKSPFHGLPKLAFCADDVSLHMMDAPEILPAGSMLRRDNTKLGAGQHGIAFTSESTCTREPSIEHLLNRKSHLA
ncbi:MAG: hypothetical protein ABTR92_19765 [Candidatus Accumulibacter phosphatis]